MQIINFYPKKNRKASEHARERLVINKLFIGKEKILKNVITRI